MTLTQQENEKRTRISRKRGLLCWERKRTGLREGEDRPFFSLLFSWNSLICFSLISCCRHREQIFLFISPPSIVLSFSCSFLLFPEESSEFFLEFFRGETEREMLVFSPDLQNLSVLLFFGSLFLFTSSACLSNDEEQNAAEKERRMDEIQIRNIPPHSILFNTILCTSIMDKSGKWCEYMKRRKKSRSKSDQNEWEEEIRGREANRKQSIRSRNSIRHEGH